MINEESNDTSTHVYMVVVKPGKSRHFAALTRHQGSKTQVMNRLNIILASLILLAIAPMASAEIYRCDGPDGPIFSDRKCGPDAANVELSDTSGLTGVTDEIKAELAEKKADRERAREEMRKLNNNRTVINNQYTTVNTEPTGRWLNYPYWRPKPERPRPERPMPPEVTPKPLPSTLGRPRK